MQLVVHEQVMTTSLISGRRASGLAFFLVRCFEFVAMHDVIHGLLGEFGPVPSCDQLVSQSRATNQLEALIWISGDDDSSHRC